MNIPLLRAIQKQILKEPKQFYMDSFFNRNPYGSRKVPNCGTAACIAGWAVTINLKSNPKEVSDSNPAPFRLANEVLQIDYDQAHSLFFTDQWPKDLAELYELHWNYPIIQAIYACERIDRFIASEGKE